VPDVSGNSDNDRALALEFALRKAEEHCKISEPY
jgi:hypothetical protein